MYDRICTLHGKKISDVGDLCPAGHVALSYERRVAHKALVPERKAGMPPAVLPLPVAPVTNLPNAQPPQLTKTQLLKPRRFCDELGRVMVLRIKETRVNGWAIHCCLSEQQKDGKLKGKYKVVQQGLTRIYGANLEPCQREFFDLCTASTKAGWKDAPHGRKLMEVPKPNAR